jgi:hypothetical protein
MRSEQGNRNISYPKWLEKFPYETYLLLVVVLTVLAFSPNSLDAFNYPKQLILAGGTFTLFSFYLFSGTNFSRGTKDSRIFSIFVLVFVVGIVFVAIHHGIAREQVFFGTFSRANGVLTYVSLGILLLMIVTILNFRGINFVRQSLDYFRICFILLMLYCTLQWLGLDPIDWNNPYTPVLGTFGNPNFASSALAILSLISLYFCFQKGSLFKKSTYALLQGLAITLIYQTKSIQGLVVYAVGVQVLIFCFILLKVNNKMIRSILVLSGFAMNILMAMGAFGVGPLGKLLFQYTLQVRMEYWRIAARMMADYPIYGVGNDSYGDFFRQYRSSDFVDQYGPNLITNNAHNSILQIGSTTGVVVMSLLVVIIFWVAFNSIRNIKAALAVAREEDSHISFYRNGQIYIILGWIGATTQSLISIDQIGIATLWWTLAGFSVVQIAFAGEQLKAIDMKKSKNEKFKSHYARHPLQGISGFVLFSTIFVLISFLLSGHVQRDYRLKIALQIAPVKDNMVIEQARSTQIYDSAVGLVEIQDYANLVIRNLYSVGPADLGFDLAALAAKKNLRSSVAFELLAVGNEFYGKFDDASENYLAALALDPLNFNTRIKFANLEVKRKRFDSALKEIEIVLRDGDDAAREQATSLQSQIVSLQK